VSDFGLAHMKRRLESGVKGYYGSIGTPLWMAPEVLRNEKYDETADVYSFGIVLWELYTQKDPFVDIAGVPELVESVKQNGYHPEIPKDCPKKLRSLIEVCLSVNPQERPNFSHMLSAFDSIILESILLDNTGRNIWLKYFAGSQLRETVSWQNFTAALLNTFKQCPLKDVEDIKWKCLKTILVRDDRVSMERFSQVLSWFGPLSDLTEFLTNIEDMLKQTWFHGDISPNEAMKRLRNEKKGTYLIRFSSKDPGGFVITVMRSNSKVKHYRVAHKPGSTFDISNFKCRRLDELLSVHRKELGLGQPCSPHPFEFLFREGECEGADEGYSVPDMDSD